jgi:RNase P subunit RPR2
MNIPTGWKRQEVVRKTGVNAGKIDIYITSPGGRTFRSKRSLAMHIKEKNLPFDINCFNFTTKNNKTSNSGKLSTSSSSLNSTQSSECSGSFDSTISDLTDNSSSEDKCVVNQNNCTISISKSTDTMTQTENCSSLVTTCAELLSKQWLTDQTMHVYLDMLSNIVLQPNDKTLIMSPAVVYGIKVLNDYNHLLNRDDLNNSNFLIMPINDANHLNDFEGSHWSVVFFDKENNKCYHYDSLNNHNIDHARIVVQKLSGYLIPDKQAPELTTISCAKQINNYDCGVYAIMATELTIQSIKQKQGIPNNLESMHVDNAKLIQKRACLAYIVNNRATISNQTIQLLMYKNEKPIFPDKVEKSEKSTQCNKWTDIDRQSHSKTNFVRNIKEKIFNIPCNNRFDLLTEEMDNKLESREETTENKTSENSKRSRHYTKQMKNIRNKQITKINKQTEVFICSDSQGRGLSETVSERSRNRVKASGWVMPNATTKQVLSHAQKIKKGPVVIISGTNDLLKNNTREIYQELERDLKQISADKPILLTTIPTRYDIAENKLEHYEYIQVNNYIKELAARINNVYILDLDHLQRYHFTKFGIHLNYRGKIKLSYMILEMLKTIQSLVPDSLGPPSNNGRSRHQIVHGTSQCREHARIEEDTITVNEVHIKKLFEDYRHDSSVAFVHCASADLHDDVKNMSRGVATIFKRHFGRPSISQCLDKQLACQEVEGGPVVYTMLTKDRYFNKPEKKNYDSAFEKLAVDFNKKKLKYLFSTPMGCIHDRISLDHFINNLISFQKNTKANINIVVPNGKSNRVLKNGLSGKEFNKRLREVLMKKIFEANETGKCEWNPQHQRTSTLSEDIPSVSISSSADFPPLLTPSLLKNQATGPVNRPELEQPRRPPSPHRQPSTPADADTSGSHDISAVPSEVNKKASVVSKVSVINTESGLVVSPIVNNSINFKPTASLNLKENLEIPIT